VIVERSESDRKLDERSARQAVSFFRHFADRCHHAKEEDLLFPAMEARGFSRESGPTGVMIHEHQQARDHVRKMDENIEAAAQGDPGALQKFTQHARAYSSLLRNHIEKEDHCLYTMANQALTDEDQQELLNAFEQVEAEKAGAGVHEKYLSIANELAERFGVPGAATTHKEHGVGHNCH
jgi:hemerythrin-like domain-containing protein